MRINKANKQESEVLVVDGRIITLPSGKKITLNDQQIAALLKMSEWLETKGDYFFTLSGPAGTGKTTITLELLKIFYEKNRWKRVAVSAPTHKARKVIGRATKEDAFTIQKLLGLRPNTELENFNINNPQFDALAMKEISNLKLLIIDEASMLNESLFDLIVKEAAAHRVKVLFMGDIFQLPPVNESISKIFTEVENNASINKVERQQDSNPLMGIYDLIRSDIKSQDDLFEHKSIVNEKGEGIVFYSDQKDFEAHVLPLFTSNEYREDPDFVKLITYSNASVQAWNKRIRDFIYDMSWAENSENKVLGAGALHPIMEGDILFAYNTVTAGRTDILIENSSDYKVQKVEEGVTDDSIDCWVVQLRSVDQNLKSEINIIKPGSYVSFLSKFNGLLKAALSATGHSRKFAWKTYYEFKNQHLLMEDIKDGRGMLVVKKDIDYGYCITTHKCLPLDSKILTSTGVVSIKNIMAGMDVVSGKGFVRSVVDCSVVLLKSEYSIKTRSGREFLSSPEHKYLMPDGSYKNADLIKSGDFISLWRSKNVHEFVFDLDYYSYGYLVGDGCYSYESNRVDISIMSDCNVIPILSKFLGKYGSSVHTYLRKGNRAVVLSAESKELRNELISVGLHRITGAKKASCKLITLNQKANFIRGLMDSDGSCDKHHATIRFVNISEGLTAELMMYLQEFGIIATRDSWPGRTEKESRKYVVNITGENFVLYSKQIGFSIDYKQRRMMDGCSFVAGKTNIDNVPSILGIKEKIKDILSLHKRASYKGEGLYANGNRTIGHMLKTKNLSYYNLSCLVYHLQLRNIEVPADILSFLEARYYYDEVVSCGFTGRDVEMMDIEVANDHNFIYNGAVVHNSQGSTFVNVAVSENNLDTNKNSEERNKLKYVAFSRPTTKAIVLSNKTLS